MKMLSLQGFVAADPLSTSKLVGFNRNLRNFRPKRCFWKLKFSSTDSFSVKNGPQNGEKLDEKGICTADELHYVGVPQSDWQLSLWRYLPSPECEIKRNHPLLLLSGVATNAVGYDLAPGASFARYMSDQGFDTWILEVRGAGLSKKEELTRTVLDVSGRSESKYLDFKSEQSYEKKDVRSSIHHDDFDEVKDNGALEKSEWETKFSELFLQVSERLSHLLNENQYKLMSARLVEQISKLIDDALLSERLNEIKDKLSNLWKDRRSTAIASQIVEMSKSVTKMVEEGQRSVPQIFDLRERLLTTVDDFLKQAELIEKYNWDFDNYLEEDLPAAINYIRNASAPDDGRLLAIGHSMGGILLYAHLSCCCRTGEQSGLSAIVALGSSLDYGVSNSSLKAVLPLADPAQALNVPVLPVGAIMTAIYPLASHPPYALAWLTSQISAQNMMHPELLRKLVLSNFCTVPAKVVLQLASAFRPGGLRNRAGTFHYKDYLDRCEVPVLAIAGDKDLICPPKAVKETARVFPQHLVTYKVFGGENDTHYGHYDLVGGRLAGQEIYPCILEFLNSYDAFESPEHNS